MSDYMASGSWQVRAGSSDEFAERWQDFLGWTRDEYPELESAWLIRSTTDPDRYLSFATWTSAESREAWKQSKGFQKRFSACRDLCDVFQGGDYLRVTTV